MLTFCDVVPPRDAFVASRVLHDRALQRQWSPLWGAFAEDGRLASILHVGPNVVPGGDDPRLIDALAERAAEGGGARMIFGERRLVERLWSLVESAYPPPREIRRRQFVYVLEPADLRPGASRAGAGLEGRPRRAERRDESQVFELSAAMHEEEMGEDPLGGDPFAYRTRVRALIDRGWTFVYERPDGELAFKMDVGCASRRTAQLQGVYAPPHLRGRGLATVGMAACCTLVLESFPTLSLYVNDFNVAAVALYERIGFRRQPYDFQTILLP